MDFIQSVGRLGIGSRMRRISDQIMKQGRAVYALYGIEFDPVNFPVYYALSQTERAGVMELADSLQLTHPAVIKQAKDLSRMELVSSEIDPQDRRRRWLFLSEKGINQLPRMQRVWEDIRLAMDDLLDTKGGLLDGLDRLERKLAADGFLRAIDNVRRKRLGSAVEILDYTPAYAADFKRINYAWIEKYFSVEEPDRKALENPDASIIRPGGAILLARTADQIVGAVAVINKGEGVYELAKMGVDEKFQGYGIGKRLVLEAIAKARALNGRRLMLETNHILLPAIRLYKRLGFREVSRPANQRSDYERSDIVMEMYL